MKLIVIVLFIFFLSAFFIISNNNIHLNNAEEVGVLYSIYFGWINQVFVNFQNITGHIIHLDWIPGNKTEGNI